MIITHLNSEHHILFLMKICQDTIKNLPGNYGRIYIGLKYCYSYFFILGGTHA
jgi:hypothetical protein